MTLKCIQHTIKENQNDLSERKSERFIRTLKNKIFKHIVAVSKNVYFDVLDDIVGKYNNTVHRSIKVTN